MQKVNGSNIIIKVKENNIILISQKKAEEDVKKKKFEDNITKLMLYISRILKNEKICELSYEVIYTLCYKICIDKVGENLTTAFKSNIENYLYQIYDECSSLLNINHFSFFRKIYDIYQDFMSKISIIQKTFMYYENNYLFKKSLPNIKAQSKAKAHLSGHAAPFPC